MMEDMYNIEKVKDAIRKYYEENREGLEFMGKMYKKINQIIESGDQKLLEGFMNNLSKAWMTRYNQEDENAVFVLGHVYEDTRGKAENKGMDVSKFPKTLEELAA